MANDIPSEQAGFDPVAVIDAALRCAIVTVLGDDFADADPIVRRSQNPDFGDYQANAAMGLAKRTGEPPRDLAARLIASVPPELADLTEPLEIAGPGFINIRLKSDALGSMVASMDSPTLGIEPDADRHSVVIDMCSVNVAKQMHVGHLRSTIIGDAIGRVFERLERRVIRQNHLGDWGVPIAMVLQQLRESGTDLDRLALPDLEVAYRHAQLATKGDERGLEAARRLHAGPHRIAELEAQNGGAQAALEAAKATLVALQQGDPELDRDWHKLIDCTMGAVYEVLELLGVRLGPDDNCGESFYRDRLAGVIDAFVRKDVAQEDQGALIVRFADRERPLLIRKSDGGYLYATTDLAAIRYRVHELEADEIIYVVDARQRDHFSDVFDGVRAIGWDHTDDGTQVRLHHLAFGSVLGADRRPLKTRSGDNVSLKSLLDEAIERGTSEVCKRAEDPAAPTHGLPQGDLAAIGRAVGIGAVKYADLQNDFVRDYVFDFDRMIAFEGDTGPYIQYAHARIGSIFARADVDPASLADTPVLVGEKAEKDLALLLLGYPGVVRGVARSLELHRLCTYLFELANAYSTFYQSCPVLKAGNDALMKSRLRLCHLTRRVIADGLGLLGIDAPVRM